MRDLLAAADGTGTYLERGEYTARFDTDLSACGRHGGFWKLEARQSFSEPDQPAWRAFNQGNYGTAAAIIAQRRPEIAQRYAELRGAGVLTHRARFVREPLSAYLRHYELPLLRLRAQCGADCSVIQLGPSDDLDALPELAIPGDALYQLDYDETGELRGATRHTQQSLIDSCREYIQDACVVGLDVETYCQDNGIA